MSTFNGLFEEIPFISADCFEIHNMESKLFFLSHCHTDHMRGLNQCTLPAPLYTSEISAMFLKKDSSYQHNLQNIETLEIQYPTQLFYSNEGITYTLLVTTIPAQHCPGSIMFIFKTDSATILYTGDFRMSKKSLEKQELLKSQYFDKVYFDSTFLNESYIDFPSEIESINMICKLTENWTNNGKNYKVILIVVAKYGYEYLIKELNRKLKKKIYVENYQLQKYSYFPSMDDCFDKSIENCSIIVANKWNKEYYKNLDKKIKYREITPSALFWVDWNKNKQFHIHEGDEKHRVAYSTHCSLNEIKDFLNIINTKSIALNVVPDNDDNTMNNLLQQITQKKINKTNKEFIELEFSKEIKFNNILKESAFCRKSKCNSENLNLLPKRKKF